MSDTSITQDFIKSILRYEDGDLYWNEKPATSQESKRWNTRHANSKAGALDSYGYRQIKVTHGGVSRLYLAHRLVWLMFYGYWPTKEIDHIDGNRTNNRIENLREATRTENNKNASVRKDSPFGIRGVQRDCTGKKYLATVNIDKKIVRLGIFVDFFEACCARKSAEIKYGYHPNHGRSIRHD